MYSHDFSAGNLAHSSWAKFFKSLRFEESYKSLIGRLTDECFLFMHCGAFRCSILVIIQLEESWPATKTESFDTGQYVSLQNVLIIFWFHFTLHTFNVPAPDTAKQPHNKQATELAPCFTVGMVFFSKLLVFLWTGTFSQRLCGLSMYILANSNQFFFSFSLSNKSLLWSPLSFRKWHCPLC